MLRLSINYQSPQLINMHTFLIKLISKHSKEEIQLLVQTDLARERLVKMIQSMQVVGMIKRTCSR
jgi:hypothetical protein